MRVIVEPTSAVRIVPTTPVDTSLSAYHCTICGALVETSPRGDTPLAMLIGTSGKPNVRVLTVAGLEVHRCPFPVIRH